MYRAHFESDAESVILFASELAPRGLETYCETCRGILIDLRAVSLSSVFATSPRRRTEREIGPHCFPNNLCVTVWLGH